MSTDPGSTDDLENPEFQKWLKQHGMPIRPDEQDYDQNSEASTKSEQADQYRLAKARKIARLYREWKSKQN